MMSPQPLNPSDLIGSSTLAGQLTTVANQNRVFLFVYPKHCPVVLDESFENGLINDGKRDYKIRSVIPVYYPRQNKVFCYEVEVI